MANYYITAIDKHTIGTHTYISRVLLHLVDNEGVHVANIRTKDAVIALIKANNIIHAALWNYSTSRWNSKGTISYEVRGNQEYLRSNPDQVQSDNLLHLLPMSNLGL